MHVSDGVSINCCQLIRVFGAMYFFLLIRREVQYHIDLSLAKFEPFPTCGC